MKKINFLLAALCSIFALSCDQKSNNESVLEVEHKSLTFEAIANEPQKVKVTAVNVDWDVKVPSSVSGWLSAVKSDSGDIEVSVQDNNSREQRSGRVEVFSSSADQDTKIITVSQKGNSNQQRYNIELNPASLTFDPLDNAPREVTITCDKENNFTWTTSLQEQSSWLSVESEPGKIIVSVKDNDEERIRVDRIIITPDDTSVEPASLVVEQMPVKVFSVENKELHYEASGWALGGLLTVKSVGVKWTIKLTDDNGSIVDWVTAKPFGDMIEIHVTSNTSPTPRIAHLRIVPDTDEFEDIVVVITQSGAGA